MHKFIKHTFCGFTVIAVVAFNSWAAAMECTPEHAAMGHCEMPERRAEHQPPHKPPSKHDCTPEHAAMGHCQMPAPMNKGKVSSSHTCTAEHAAMGHCVMPQQQSEPKVEPASDVLPEPTEADLAAAFPDLDGMDLRKHMDTPLLAFVLVDQLEWGRVNAGADGENLFAWNATGWIGYDINRFWWRTEGEQLAGELEAAEVSLLYGRAVSRWWDVVAGVRHDFKPEDAHGDGQTFAAVGIQGLAPYWFETELTLFVGEDWQTLLRAEFEYEVMFSQRLVLTPDIELNLASRDDPERGTGAGLVSSEIGLRLRYEIVREFAPYVGVNWTQRYGKTADLAEHDSELAWLAGVRWWW